MAAPGRYPLPVLYRPTIALALALHRLLSQESPAQTVNDNRKHPDCPALSTNQLEFSHALTICWVPFHSSISFRISLGKSVNFAFVAKCFGWPLCTSKATYI